MLLEELRLLREVNLSSLILRYSMESTQRKSRQPGEAAVVKRDLKVKPPGFTIRDSMQVLGPMV